MSQAGEVSARLAQTQTAHSHRTDLKDSPDQVIQAHAFGKQIAARLRGRELLSAFLFIGCESLGLDQGEIALARPIGKGAGAGCVAVAFQAAAHQDSRAFHGERHLLCLARKIDPKQPRDMISRT